jgi:hypothetical protein
MLPILQLKQLLTASIQGRVIFGTPIDIAELGCLAPGKIPGGYGDGLKGAGGV